MVETLKGLVENMTFSSLANKDNEVGVMEIANSNNKINTCKIAKVNRNYVRKEKFVENCNENMEQIGKELVETSWFNDYGNALCTMD